MSCNPRAKVAHLIAETRVHEAGAATHSEQDITNIFGQYVFDDRAMKRHLTPDVYGKLKNTIRNREPLEAGIADSIAKGMMEWAMANGATHFTHWFQPMTGLTAEKHDSFFSPIDGGGAISKFSGKELVKGEPDASSFPSGGLRATFEARGYTAWDPTSPAFLQTNARGKTLTIPTAFCSYTGFVLDKKTPLLRSIEVVSKQAVRLLRVFGNKTAQYVYPTVGPEQEYFLIDRHYYNLRPDLIATGRTLFGAVPPKGQQMEDHYFGSVRQRVLSCMIEVESELFKLGIPVKTRHNEVAPAQFEFAPLFEHVNIATDHNLLVMEKLQNIAQKHGLVCLLHEKPFAGVNGSGKHNNYSLSDSDGNNLLDPGSTPHDNAQFLAFLVAIIRAVNKYADILRVSVCGAGNDHRLGANEAPPAIISIFLGDQLTDIVEQIEKGRATGSKSGGVLEIGVTTMPILPKDATDRNRTSPFAFTGNKFEFRAVGSNQTISGANIALNTIVAESLDYFATKLEAAAKNPGTFMKSVQELLQKEIAENKRIIFNGDNYTDEWKKEAKRRGLPNFVSTVEALPAFISEKSIELFTKYKVFNETEVEARYEIMLENYIKTVKIEADLCAEMARNQILPASIQYQRELASTIQAGKSVDPKLVQSGQKDLLKKVASLNSSLYRSIDELVAAKNKANDAKDYLGKAKNWNQKVLPLMLDVRHISDELEQLVDDRLWPLPKYREMLFLY